MNSNFKFSIKGTHKKDLINELRIYEIIKFGSGHVTRVMLQHALESVVDDEAQIRLSIFDYNSD